MYDLATIKEMQLQAAKKAAEEGNTPLYLWPDELNLEGIRRFPFIGNYLPNGWYRVELTPEVDPNRRGIYGGDNEGYGAYFIDSSGFSGTSEAALSAEEFLERLTINYAYGIVEVGQFQVKVGLFSNHRNNGGNHEGVL